MRRSLETNCVGEFGERSRDTTVRVPKMHRHRFTGLSSGLEEAELCTDDRTDGAERRLRLCRHEQTGSYGPSPAHGCGDVGRAGRVLRSGRHLRRVRRRCIPRRAPRRQGRGLGVEPDDRVVHLPRCGRDVWHCVWVTRRLGRQPHAALGDSDPFGFLDTGLGALTAVIGMLLIVWLLASSLATVPQSGIGATIQDSSIVHWLEDVMPPVPDVAARLGRLTDPLGFPRVFAGLEPSPASRVTGPLPVQVQAAADAATRSTVQLRGEGCGGILYGSGWVAGTNMVVTNAHVIAGIADPVVHDTNGDHHGTPIVFDADADIAVLRVSDLAGRPLTVVPQNVGRGAVGAALGYPGGGQLAASSAAALDAYDALGRNIYGTGLVRRSVVELQADVRPGNSGGPFVLTDGRVGGMVFARSVSTADIGYALAASTLRSELTRAASFSVSVSTGSCAAA